MSLSLCFLICTKAGVGTWTVFSCHQESLRSCLRYRSQSFLWICWFSKSGVRPGNLYFYKRCLNCFLQAVKPRDLYLPCSPMSLLTMMPYNLHTMGCAVASPLPIQNAYLTSGVNKGLTKGIISSLLCWKVVFWSPRKYWFFHLPVWLLVSWFLIHIPVVFLSQLMIWKTILKILLINVYIYIYFLKKLKEIAFPRTDELKKDLLKKYNVEYQEYLQSKVSSIGAFISWIVFCANIFLNFIFMSFSNVICIWVEIKETVMENTLKSWCWCPG